VVEEEEFAAAEHEVVKFQAYTSCKYHGEALSIVRPKPVNATRM
jgi:hypothetical protein